MIAIGVAAVIASAIASTTLRPAQFWSDEDRAAASQAQQHFGKLHTAYVLENRRRAAAAEPLLTELPEALNRARLRLEEANGPLRVARQRPQQIATALRLGGVALIVAGLVACLARRREAPAAT